MDKKILSRVDKWVLWFFVTLFCVLSLVIYYYTPGLKAHFEGDSVRYHFIAHNLTSLTRIPLEVLGYPTVLAVLYRVWDGVLIVVLVQMLLSILSLFLVRSIVKRLTDESLAFIAATCFWGLNLGFLIYTQLLLIEVSLAFLLLLFIDRIIVYYQHESLRYCAQAALVLGISILFRPAALFYALCFAGLLLFITKISFVKRLLSVLIFLLFFYLPIIVYMTINYFYFGSFVICPVMNINLFAIYYPKLQAAFHVQSIAPNELTRAIELDIAQEHITGTTQLNLLKLWLQQPSITVGIWLINMLKSFVGLYQTQWKLYFEMAEKATSYFCLQGSRLSCLAQYIYTGTLQHWLHVLGWYELCYLIVEYSMVFLGSIFLFLQRRYWLLCFALTFVWYFAFITGPDGSGRFRMMVEPWLLVLACLGVAFLVVRARLRARKKVVV